MVNPYYKLVGVFVCLVTFGLAIVMVGLARIEASNQPAKEPAKPLL